MKRQPSRFHRKVGGRVPPKWSSVPGRLLRQWPDHRLVSITLPSEAEAGDLLLADRSLDEDEMQELQIELNQFKLDLEDTYAENEEDEFDLDDDDEDFDPELN